MTGTSGAGVTGTSGAGVTGTSGAGVTDSAGVTGTVGSIETSGTIIGIGMPDALIAYEIDPEH